MRVKVTITGQEKLRRRLASLPKRISAKADEALARGARRVARQAKATVPVHTGGLRDTIRDNPVKTDKRGRRSVSVVAGSKRTEERATTGTFQRARLVEFGTVDTQAEPFFFPAWRANKRSIQTALRRAVSVAVRET